MKMAKVIGNVVCTQKVPHLNGQKLMILQPVNSTMEPVGAKQVGVDVVNAGVGDVVIFCGGSSARRTGVNKDHPCDCAIVSIVDTVNVDGERVFNKAEYNAEHG